MRRRKKGYDNASVQIGCEPYANFNQPGARAVHECIRVCIVIVIVFMLSPSESNWLNGFKWFHLLCMRTLFFACALTLAHPNESGICICFAWSRKRIMAAAIHENAIVCLPSWRKHTHTRNRPPTAGHIPSKLITYRESVVSDHPKYLMESKIVRFSTTPEQSIPPEIRPNWI